MLYYSTSTTYSLHFRSDKSNKVHDITHYKTKIGNEFSKTLLLAHSFTSCDTTSASYDIRKRTILNCFVTNEDFKNITNVFMNPRPTHSQVDKKAALIIRGATRNFLGQGRFREIRAL